MTKKIKLTPGEFTPIYATFKDKRTILYTMDILTLLKNDPDVNEIKTTDGEIIYKQEV